MTEQPVPRPTASGPIAPRPGSTGVTDPTVRFERASLRYRDRVVWSDLSLACEPGSFTAILGPNGAGKTSLLKVILGLSRVSEGRVEVLGREPRRGDPGIGYVPQHQSFDRDLPLRGRDLVRLGVDGHRWGIGRSSPAIERAVDAAIESVEAGAFASAPIGRLSGGEQQRLRIAQALVGDPRLLLCDEPLASLDLRHQQEITDLIGGWQRRTGGTVLFVTHDVNPVLPLVDRIIFVVNGRWAAGTPDEVLTSERLTELYGSHVDVLRVHGRVLVVGETTDSGFDLEEPHHLPVIDDEPGVPGSGPA
jgi:zinc/manganese transport system ATP-binding protein